MCGLHITKPMFLVYKSVCTMTRHIHWLWHNTTIIRQLPLPDNIATKQLRHFASATWWRQKKHLTLAKQLRAHMRDVTYSARHMQDVWPKKHVAHACHLPSTQTSSSWQTSLLNRQPAHTHTYTHTYENTRHNIITITSKYYINNLIGWRKRRRSKFIVIATATV